jgi:hypothetical protein
MTRMQTTRTWRVRAVWGGAAALLALALGAAEARAIERNFAGSAQLDYLLVPSESSGPNGRSAFDGFTSEVALKVAVDVSEKLSANAKLCHGCHGFELAMAYFDFRVADELVVRVGRFSPSFGSFNIRHDPANHASSDKPLPYDMGRMLRLGQWNLGVIPSPFPDNGLEVGGTHWFGERAQLDYAAYAVSGFRANAGSLDLDWTLSESRASYVVDNNGRPAVGGRLASTFRLGETNDLTLGASFMYGTWDPANRFWYVIAGADLAARVGRTQLRMEYLARRQTFPDNPAFTFELSVPASGREVFVKHGAYVELERAMTERLGLFLRADGLYRDGNVTTVDPLAPRAAVFRYTAGGTVGIVPGWRLKASAEAWAFSNHPPRHEDWELAFHLAMVGTF